MKLRHLTLILAFFALWAMTAQAAGPTASPFANTDQNLKTTREIIPSMVDKAFGDPADLKAAAIAAADYVRYMQADVTEDNAGNGFPAPAGTETDPNDAGWDWSLTPFEHSGEASSLNLYGATVNGIFQVYQFAPDPALFTAMKDAADHMVTAGPASIRSAADMVFLLEFASLPDVTNDSYYTDGARAMWQYRLDNYGGTATSFAEALRDYRGNTGWPNGIIPWDLAPYAESLMVMEGLFPGNNYGSDAAEIVEVIYADSYSGLPGYFEPFGHSQGFDPTGSNADYWSFTNGVAGIIRAFETSGLHTAEIAALEALLHECQYDDGAFSNQYGAQTSFDDRDWQGTAYAVWCLNENLAPTAPNLASLYNAGTWLASTQDASGAWVYDSGTHYPEIGGECTAAIAVAYEASAITLTTTPDGPDPATCGLYKNVTFAYDRNDATPGLRGYEITFEVIDPNSAVSFDQTTTLLDIADGGALASIGNNYFQKVNNGDGTYTVSDAILGATVGLLVDGNLFTLTVLTQDDGPVDVNILSYKLRDPDNAFMFADMTGTSFVVDCTPPAAVTGITADPRHNKVDVSWAHADLGDVDHFEVYRGLWYYTAVGTTAYPEYDDVGAIAPTRPTGYGVFPGPVNEWVPVDNGVDPITTLAYTDEDVAFTAGRGVYYYEVFAVDAAGNGSAPAAANDRATNYWLGDVVGVPDAPNPPTGPNGIVDSIDMSELGASFGVTGLTAGDAEYVLDVGPTDDWSRVGIPTTDAKINFEDLMVFSMNYGVVTAAKANTPLSSSVDLAWVMNNDGSMALRLVNGTGLKGLRVQAASPVTHVSAGQLLDTQSELTFLKNVGTNLDASVAVMGVNNGFSGSGDLMVIAANSLIQAEDLTITARGIDNSELTVNLDKTSDTATPRVFALHANYPNPFNPMTKISFSLPEAQSVDLSVYSLDGRKVATLISGTQSAGLHEVVWMGKDDRGHTAASGTYFYRINAGPYSQVHKMTLMK